jgi:aminoglycoside phosphotransferase family enzyme/predicted kinase
MRQAGKGEAGKGGVASVQEQDQAGTIAFLRAELQGMGGAEPVEIVQTHISVILLGKTLAWKLKKAVAFPYLDFRRVEQRLALCKRELALNRRTAPLIYKRVRRVVRTADGGLRLDGDGALVEAVLEMQRFDEACVLDRMAIRGELTPQIITRLARVIADFHERAKPASGLTRSGSQRIGDILQINDQALDAARTVIGKLQVDRLVAATRELWQRHSRLLDERQHTGHVRLCHGDLHLRNIVLIAGMPTLFDCLEFDADLATIDTLYDLAFVLMDLWHRDLQGLANLLLNRYLNEADAADAAGGIGAVGGGDGETQGLALLGLFMSMRATVRGHVQASRALAMDDADVRRKPAIEEARAYLALAANLLQPRPARLVAIGGLSGSGKSTAAAAVAAAVGAPPGARVLSSDRVRKALHGVAPQTRLGPQAYRPEVSERVYAVLREQAAATLATGHSVIVDAVFDRQAERERIEAVASACATPFQGVWLEAPQDVLLERVDKRRGDPSDADADVVRRQLERDLGSLHWTRLPAGGEQDWSSLRRLLG